MKLTPTTIALLGIASAAPATMLSTSLEIKGLRASCFCGVPICPMELIAVSFLIEPVFRSECDAIKAIGLSLTSIKGVQVQERICRGMLSGKFGEWLYLY